MHAVKWLEAQSYGHCTGTVEKIDQTQLQWYLGQFLRAPAGPGRFLRLDHLSLIWIGVPKTWPQDRRQDHKDK